MLTLPPIPEPALVVMMGASGAGKSTLSRALARQDPAVAVVSYDACREEITGDAGNQDATRQAVELAHRRVRERCQQRRTTIVDGVHTRPEHRAVLVDLADHHRMPAVLIVLNTPLVVCLARQATRAPRAPGARWGRQVPADVVTRQHGEIQQGLLRPGLLGRFAHVHIVTHHGLVS